MGKEVVYCFNCGVRLLRADFERGAAFKVGSECTCSDCLPDLLALLPPEERAAFKKGQAAPEIHAAPRRGTGRVPMADRPTRKITSTRIRARPHPEEEEEEEELPAKRPAKARSKLLPLLAATGGLLAVVFLAVFMLSRKRPAPPGDVLLPQPPPTAAGAPPAKSPEDLARELLQKAREYQAKNPGDYEGQFREFQHVVWEFEKTPAGEEARREALAIQKKINEGMTPELEKLLEEIRGPREREEYKKILDRLDKAKDENPKPAWILQVDKRIDEVRGEAEKKFQELKAKAEEVKGKGEKEELAKLRERVARWEIARYVEEFDAAFGTAAPSETAKPEKPDAEKPAAPKGPVRNEEGKAYLERWMAAVAPATNRDYEAALGRLEQAGKGLTEDLWKQEAAEDLRDLRAVEALYRAALKAVAGYGPGTLVSLEVVTASGSREVLQGVVTLADEDHLEIRREGKKDVAFVCPEDLTAPSLVRAAQGAGHTRGAELRAGALLMLLEGEIEAARKGLVADIPEKYWEYAKTARERAPRSEGGEARREREAKLLFWGAGKDFLQMETMGAAIEKYKMLARDYVGASVVRKNIDLITRRSEAGKEYFLTSRDLKGSGAVKPASHPELKSCWTCGKDVGENPAEARDTYVEIEFHALPQTSYQCWVYAGACCEETFTTYLQATEMTGPNPRKTSEKIPYDVGGPVAAPLIPKLKGLKKTHAQHGGEKQASRWEWIAVPLPKYASGGLKKVRLMVEHKGFSVAAALVSSVRKEPPKPEEMAEEFRRAAEEAASRPRSGGLETGLVGHWKLDEQGGSVARDHSGQGNNGAIKGGPKPVPGRIGGALEFDGNDDVIEIAGGPSLQKLQEGSYTISVWFQPKDKPPGRDKDNRAAYGIVNKPGYHEGLKYTGDKKFAVEHWLTSDDPKKPFETSAGTWNETFEPGQWYHVVCVVDAAARTVTVYVNGKSKGTSRPWDAKAKGRDYGSAPWRIGHANPGAKEYAWPAKAAIDDVRLYNRALTAQEVQVLYGLGTAGMDQ